jgi:hypothetical protein
MRVYSDPLPPAPADFAFVFGQTADNQDSVLQQARYLLASGQTARVGFLDAPPMSGYPGFAAWHKWLADSGVPPNQIEGVPFGNHPLIHSRIEAADMLQHARTRGYRTVLVLAAPFHQLRAFMTTVTVALETHPDVRLHSVPGLPLPWLEQAVHSQGQVSGQRRELVASEWTRIEKYTQQGDLATVEQALAYLNRRDGL